MLSIQTLPFSIPARSSSGAGEPRWAKYICITKRSPTPEIIVVETAPRRLPEPQQAGIHRRDVRPARRRAAGRVKLKVEHLYVDGDTTIAELLSTSTTNEDAWFDNRYCWVCRFDGDMIVEVRAYLDSMMVDYTIRRNELAKQ